MMTHEPEIEEPRPANDDAGTGEPAAPGTQEELMRAASARINELEAERESFRDRWMRAEAEIANVRARAKREVEDARLFAVQNFARDIVEAADNLRRGLESLPKPVSGEPEVVTRLREGFEGIERGLLATLERNGIRREDPTGAAFDPNRHQAMAEQASVEHPPGTVLAAWTPAWTLNGRLLKPAMVVLAKGEPAEIAPPGTVQGGEPGAASGFDRTA